ncbi:hypothetical protein Cgig2_009267 [Carnegiea gigantea]|uniref:SOSEKI DIX-like domain-containing protein n=1 Tax=Carnegiea gigantea TaxID=171969 RepID=A0A9Q1Q9U9_9CARY|nr:hypothetical protein Cgig2_009267 [Carnegiea gigantea]
MAMASNRGRPELQRKWKERENTISPERTKDCSEPLNKFKPNNSNYTQKRFTVPVVYYLCQNGQLQHPHFMEVPLSSPHGLFLRDVISRLNILRGKAMASQYSWSSKRSYKNGYVWQDLEENDFIYPVHGGEYVLKGSEILETGSKSLEPSSPAGTNRRRNQSWGSIDLHEYKVYKAESTRESDASTQTDDQRRRRIRAAIKEEEIEDVGDGAVEERDKVGQSTELSREEISPPPSDSSPETLESLIKADGRLILASSSSSTITTSLSKASMQALDQDDHQSRKVNQAAGNCPSGKMKAPSVIMSLISCGSLSFRDCGVAAVKDHGMSLISNYKTRLPSGENQTAEDHDAGDDDVIGEIEKNARNRFAKMAIEDKEYFSGSLLMETNTNKDEFSAPKLQRSSSYNSDRSSHLKMAGKEEGVTARCIPRRPKKTRETSTHIEHEAEITNAAINKTTQAGN